MAADQVKCPACNAVLRLTPDSAPGQEVRCPKCNMQFAPGEEVAEAELLTEPRRRRSNDDSAPRRRRPAQKSNTTLIALAILAAVVLVAGGLVAIGLLSKKKDESVASATAPAAGTGIRVGQQAMEIDGEDIDGHRFKLSDYRGKVVVLDFWGDW
jgi:predicted Zn finger-like uncharacterized protein